MVHIRTIKLFNGEKRYAVVAPFKSTVVVKEQSKVEGEKAKKKVIEKTEHLVVDYKTGTGINEQILPAIFPVTAEGLKQAKEIQKLFKKSSKK
jgi:hypothetical protein